MILLCESLKTLLMTCRAGLAAMAHDSSHELAHGDRGEAEVAFMQKSTEQAASHLSWLHTENTDDRCQN